NVLKVELQFVSGLLRAEDPDLDHSNADATLLDPPPNLDFVGTVGRKLDHELRASFALEANLNKLQPPQCGKSQRRGRETQTDLATPDAKAYHGCEPECGRRRDAGDQTVPADNRARADKAEAGQDAERQA